MPIGKNKSALQVYIKKETKDKIVEMAKQPKSSASKVAGKLLDEAFEGREKKCTEDITLFQLAHLDMEEAFLDNNNDLLNSLPDGERIVKEARERIINARLELMRR